MGLKISEILYNIITQISNIGIYFELAYETVKPLFDTNGDMLIFLLQLPISGTILLILCCVFTVLATIIMINMILYFILPIILIKKFSKENENITKLLIPFYNTFYLCHLTKTDYTLYFFVTISMLFNKPFLNILLTIFGENYLLNNNTFILLSGSIFASTGLIFFITLWKNLNSFIDLTFITKRCPLCNSKVKPDDKVCSTCGYSFSSNASQSNDINEPLPIEKRKLEEKKILNNNEPVKAINPTVAIYKEKERPIITEKPKKKCPNCGAGNGLEAKYCFICNTEFKDNK